MILIYSRLSGLPVGSLPTGLSRYGTPGFLLELLERSLDLGASKWVRL